MTDSPLGLYERLISEALQTTLNSSSGTIPKTKPLRDAEAADRIAFHLAKVIERAIDGLHEKERASKGIELARALVSHIDELLGSRTATPARPVEPGEVLSAITLVRPDGTPGVIKEPMIPLLDTALLTNAPGEPRVGHQLNTEIDSADRIDVVMAFIRLSGIRPLLPSLQQHHDAGRRLRILTTTFTGTTEARALDVLLDHGAEVRISYDTTLTRLHAKAWLFHRASGFSTAYIGSSNLTYSAQESGLEWNVRVSGARNPAVIDKTTAVFESYWHDDHFVAYDPDEFAQHTASVTKSDQIHLAPIEIRPEPFQARLLEQIAIARRQGHHRNLLVSATGTGKTVMAALDYAQLAQTLPRARLLFIAHRKEILQQSRATFCYALRDPSFGELWVDGKRPSRFEHVFASVQSLARTDLDHLDPAYFDVVIIDEFHHAAARSYNTLLDHLNPHELIGLTATPERADGLSVLEHFGGRIAAELRLWDAIDQRRLVPFAYFGLSDGIDLSHVPWKRGHGYDIEGLSNVLTSDDANARFVLKTLAAHSDDASTIKALGFCVSVKHACFMARVFNLYGVTAKAVWADTSAAEREASLHALANGELRVLFSVDLFNEGLDVPSVNTLLMLRPTESGTLFLQQLGRGLRRQIGKTSCTVLDFVGLHRTEFRFDKRLRALLGGTRKHVRQQVESGFPFLPSGCHMQFDAQSSETVLRSLRSAIPNRWNEKANELRALYTSRLNEGVTDAVTLSMFLQASDFDLEDVYYSNHGWSDLCQTAGIPLLAAGPHEQTLRRACGRLLHVDDPIRIKAWRKFLTLPQTATADNDHVVDTRLLRMLIGSVTEQAINKTTTLEEGLQLLLAHPQICLEIVELLQVLEARMEHLSEPLMSLPMVPLQVHARYTRIEILAACGVGEGAKVSTWQTGVYNAREVPADLLAFTLDKTSGAFSPTTRYRDYAINRNLIHWESQSATRADSETGRRYQQHVSQGSSIMLFARGRADERAFYLLGTARYISHESEQPMAIVWQLDRPLPGDLYAEFAAAVA